MQAKRTRTRHKTLWLTVIWLIFLAVGLALQAVQGDIPRSLPLARLVNVTGGICLAYVVGHKAGNLIQAVQAPAGQFGFDHVPASRDKLLWVTVTWLFLLAEALVVHTLVLHTVDIPLTEIVGYTGGLSTMYVALDKGTKAAAASGRKNDDTAKAEAAE